MLLDFRYIDIEHELWAISEYFRATERLLPILAEQERKRVFEEWEGGKKTDEDNWELILQELYELTVNLLPRFFRSPILVSLWAIYESAASQIANDLQQRGSYALRLRDIKGDNSFDSLQKYYAHVLHFELFREKSTADILEMLLVLRNAIAHGNGRKDAVNENYWRKIQVWQKSGKGILADDDYLTYTPQFIEEMLNVVNESLSDLIIRAKAVK
jgi:hypothetical protein